MQDIAFVICMLLLRSLEMIKDLIFLILAHQKACNLQKYKSSLHISFVCVSLLLSSPSLSFILSPC